MASDSKPTSKDLVPSTPISSQSSQLRIRTNLVTLKPMKFYVPDDDDFVPYAFALGRQAISTAKGSEGALLSGYFSTLCAVLPDLTDVAKKIMKNVGFQAEEIMVPSQADRMNIEIPQSDNANLEALKFVQICFLPFLNSSSINKVDGFWNRVADSTGVVLSSSKLLCSVNEMITIYNAFLTSGLREELQSQIVSSFKGLATRVTPISRIISVAKWTNLYDYYYKDVYGKNIHG